MIKTTFVLATSLLMMGASLAHADQNAQSKFERHLREYFASFTDGRDVVDDIHYTHPVDADYTRSNRSDRPIGGRGIEFELAYVRVFKRILCRVGIGYASMNRYEFDVDPAVFIECAPMTNDQLNLVTSADLLPDQFEVARVALLGTKPSLWRDISAGIPHYAAAFSFDGRLPRLKAARLYFLVGGPSRQDRVERIKAVHVGQVRLTYDNGNTQTSETTGELWEVDFAKLGEEVLAKSVPTKTSTPATDDKSCRRPLMGRLLDWVPGPLG